MRRQYFKKARLALKVVGTRCWILVSILVAIFSTLLAPSRYEVSMWRSNDLLDSLDDARRTLRANISSSLKLPLPPPCPDSVSVTLIPKGPRDGSCDGISTTLVGSSKILMDLLSFMVYVRVCVLLAIFWIYVSFCFVSLYFDTFIILSDVVRTIGKMWGASQTSFLLSFEFWRLSHHHWLSETSSRATACQRVWFNTHANSLIWIIRGTKKSSCARNFKEYLEGNGT